MEEQTQMTNIHKLLCEVVVSADPHEKLFIDDC